MQRDSVISGSVENGGDDEQMNSARGLLKGGNKSDDPNP